MKLRIYPQPDNEAFQKLLQLLITVEPDGRPEVYVGEGILKPDRHLVLGIAQSMAVQIEEKDPETVVFIDSAIVDLEWRQSIQRLTAGLIIARTVEEGAIAALVLGDPSSGRRLARQAIRALTGTIRLDVP